MSPTTTVPSEGARLLGQEITQIQRLVPPAPPVRHGTIGKTMFDLPGSEDLSVTVLLNQQRVQLAPSQSLVRITSQPDGRKYLGVISAGPFVEPDSLRADSPVLLAVATQGGEYMPRCHGRVQVTILGEELADGSLAPPRLRPLPHSPVALLDDRETARVLKVEGDIRLGQAVGHEGVLVGVPSKSKMVLPRHLAILGTTGSGKSTTVAGLICEAAQAGLAVVVLDVEGEYTFLHQPVQQRRMREMLLHRGLSPAGVPAAKMNLYHLVDRDTTNPGHPNRHSFSLQFARLSPYTVAEMLQLSDAQTDRYLFAYELAKTLMRDLGLFPDRKASAEERQRQEQFLVRLDEFDRGYPRLKLSLMLDVVGLCKAAVTRSTFRPFNAVLNSPEGESAVKKLLNPKDVPTNAGSWGRLHSLLWRLARLKVFDRHDSGGRFLKYREMLQPGQVSVIDLSEAGMTELSNIAVADVLRGIQEAQESAYRDFEASPHRQVGEPPEPPRVLLIVEEAHEFLSAERIDRTPHLFDQVCRIAKRGRKRWLSLAFVTQSPAHLPRQVFGLVNSFILHKLSDPAVLSPLRRSIPGMDDGLWNRLASLAPGQAVVSFPHMARAMLTSVDPAPCKLRMVD
jgi:DNA helicase HerA-like ATPase